jgi:hypothetical protein
MPWPTSTDYNEAIQNPQVCFADADLRQGEAAGVMGLPTPFSGNFADVYKMVCPDGRSWAVKCFTRPVEGLHARYQAISDHLQERTRPFMVEFQYLEQGIKVKGEWFPAVKMSWVEGFALNQFVADHAPESGLLEKLAELWLKLAYQLREARMAHGDLQHGNVLLVPGSKANALALKLIDYDGMCVPALADRPSGELGHRNYQHPKRKDGDAYHPEMDRFSNLAIYTALHCVRAAGGLWSKYGDPENLLFRQQDFAEPASSTLFKELWLLQDREARTLTGHLVLASAGALADVPLLTDLVSGGAVRPLATEDEGRVESLLFARAVAARKSKFDPRANQTTPPAEPAKPNPATVTQRVRRPVLPADPSRPEDPVVTPRRTRPAAADPAKRDAATAAPTSRPSGEVRRRTAFPAATTETVPVMKAVPVPVPPLPVPADLAVPPVPVMAAVVVPPPLPGDGPPPLPAAPMRMPELLPVPLPALRTPADDVVLLPLQGPAEPRATPAPPARRKKQDDDDDDSGFLSDRPGLVWGVAGAVVILLGGLLAWWLWPAKKHVDPGTPTATVTPRLHAVVEGVDLRGGDQERATVAIDWKTYSRPVTVQVDGLPPLVTCPPVTVAPGQAAQIVMSADPHIEAGEFRPSVSLWVEKEKVDSAPLRLTITKRPTPRLVNLKPLVWKIGETREIDFEVDRQGNPDPLSLEIDNCPQGVTYQVVPFFGWPDRPPAPDPNDPDGLRGGPPPEMPPDLPSFVRVRFVVARDAEPVARGFVKLRLVAGTIPVVPEPTLAYSIEQAARLLPRLILPPTLTLAARGATDLQVNVNRQDYVGAVAVRVENLPAGVTCPPSAVIPEGETLVRLEFRTDGTAAAGSATVEVVVATADATVVDRKKLTLLVPKAGPPDRPRDPVDPPEPKGPHAVGFRSADDVALRGTFYPGPQGRRSKCVLLLHDAGQSRNEANLVRLAQSLNGEGYAVLTLDFRGHGESVRVGKAFGDFPHNRDVRAFPGPVRLGGRAPDDDTVGTINRVNFPAAYYPHFVDDVVAAKAFLDEKDRKGQVDAANLVVVGIGDGATVGSLWLATESARHRSAAPGAMAKYQPVPEVRHVAGAVWINFRLTLGGLDRGAALGEWLRSAGRHQAVPMTFVYGQQDRAGQSNALKAVEAIRPAPRLTQALAVPQAGLVFGHLLLAQGLNTERIVLDTVKQMLDRPDGAAQLPRPAGEASFWVIAGNPVPARREGDALFQPVPVDRFGVPR